MTHETPRHREAVDLECRNIHDAITSGKISAEDGQRWQLVLRALLARAETAEAKASKANTLLLAITKYLKGEPSNPPVTGVEKKDLADEIPFQEDK